MAFSLRHYARDCRGSPDVSPALSVLWRFSLDLFLRRIFGRSAYPDCLRPGQAFAEKCSKVRATTEKACMMASVTENRARSQTRSEAVAAVIAELAAQFGNRLVTSTAVREQHANTTTWVENEPADAVVFPQTTQDVQQIVRICAAHGVPVIAFGTGTSLEGQVNAPQGGVCIDMRDMNRVLAVHAEDLDCVVEPGITRKTLNEQLRDQGLFFPIDPGADASLGGMTATRASGTNAVRYATMRDNVLALKGVRGD